MNLLDVLNLVFSGDIVDPKEFEEHCCTLLKAAGYINVQLTKFSRDYGVDILAEDGVSSYAIQCKLYSNPVGVEAIQEVVAGKYYYRCDKTAVMTNSQFTDQAIELAAATKTILWDYNQLIRWEYLLVKSLSLSNDTKGKITDAEITAALHTERVKEASLHYNHAILASFNAGYTSVPLLKERCAVRPGVAKILIERMEKEGLIKPWKKGVYSIYEEKLDEILSSVKSKPQVEILQNNSVDTLQELETGYSFTTEMLQQAVKIIIDAGQASTSLLQRRLHLKYVQASQLIDELERYGVIGPHEGSKPRQILLTRQQMLDMDFETKVPKDQAISEQKYEAVDAVKPKPEKETVKDDASDPPEDYQEEESIRRANSYLKKICFGIAGGILLSACALRIIWWLIE